MQARGRLIAVMISLAAWGALASKMPPTPPVLAKVQRQFLKNPRAAKVCIVHLHGEEQKALAAAKHVQSKFCANLIYIDRTAPQDATSRYVRIKVKPGLECQSDPNRIFTAQGMAKDALPFGCAKKGDKPKQQQEDRQQAVRGLTAFRDQQLLAALRACSLDSQVPVVAMHNNVGLSLAAFQKGGEYFSVRESSVRLLRGRKNPSAKAGQRAGDFYLTTRVEDFDRLAPTRNVVWQTAGSPKPDDGSLSVLMKRGRYINQEVGGRTGSSTQDEQLIDELMKLIGVPQGCH